MGLLSKVKGVIMSRMVANLIGPTVGLCAYGYSIVPQMYKDFFASYRLNNEQTVEPDGKTPLKLHTDLFRMKSRILFQLKAAALEPKVILFMSKRFSLDHFGSIKSQLSKGCLLDIPVYFNWQVASDITNYKRHMNLAVPVAIPILQQPKIVEINWNSLEGKKYEDSFLLSNNAKQFALATEISLSNNNMFMDSVAIMRGSAVCGAIVSSKMFVNLTRRLIMTPAIFMAWYFVYAGSKHVVLRHRLNTVHQNLASIDKSYIEGGVEYYTKLLQRNLAIRQILGKGGEKLYTCVGNEVTPIYRFQPPTLSDKLKSIESYAATDS